jgi:hypothetical protein
LVVGSKVMAVSLRRNFYGQHHNRNDRISETRANLLRAAEIQRQCVVGFVSIVRLARSRHRHFFSF